MAHDDDNARDRARQPFTFYAARGRVYARNRDQKIIDLGSLAREEGGAFRYALDGNHLAGSGFFTEEEALRNIAERIRFLWLDGQFTAVADAKEDASLNLDGAKQIDVEIDELPPGEREFDATV
jgi:hypothetical protein